MPDPLELPSRPTVRPVAWIALAVSTLAVLLVHLEIAVRRTGVALFSFDSAEYALAGRTLATTGRLATPFAHPAILASIPGPPFPLLVGHPLVPVLDALVFAIGGARPALTLIPAGAAFIAVVVLTAVLARRVSASPWVPWTAAAAVALSPWVLRYAIEGLSELPFVALFMAALILLLDLRERPRPLLLGMALGLAHLARPVVVPLLPVWLSAAWFAVPAGTRRGAMARLLLGFAPFAALLALYKWVAIGSPFADVGGTLLLARLTPELTTARLNRMFPGLDPAAVLAAHPGALTHKAIANAPALLWAVLTRAGRLVTVLFVLRMVLPPGRGERREWQLRLVVLGCGALLSALALLTVPDPRMLLCLLPAFIVMGFDEADRLARVRPGAQRLAPALGVLLVLVSSAVPTLGVWREDWRSAAPEAGRYRESEWRGLGEGVAPLLPGQGAVASDAAPWIAWFSGRNATLIPADTTMLARLGRRLPLAAIVITDEWLIHQPGEEVWRGWFEGRVHDSRWRPAGRVTAGRLSAVVFVPR